jgi:Polysaccharide lyase
MRKSSIAFIFGVFSMSICAQSVSAPIDVYDGFEGSTLSNIWESSRFVSGAVQIQSSIVRAGHGALRVTVHPRDIFEAGNGNKDSERDEILESVRLNSREGIFYEFSWSMYLPANFPIVPVRLVVAQWKQYCQSDSGPCSDDSPALAVRYTSGVLRITQNLDHRRIVLYEEKRDLRGSWSDLRFQVRFSRRETGRVKAWLNQKKVIDYRGITASRGTGYGTPSRFYFKMGLYRDVMPQPMTIYLDEYRKREIREDYKALSSH